MARKVTDADGLRSVGDETSFERKGWTVRARVEADEIGGSAEDEPPGGDYIGVVVEVGRRVRVEGAGWHKERFVVLGESALWGIDSLEGGYGTEVVSDQFHEAMIEAEKVLAALAEFSAGRGSL